ncbi:MAG: hypothetical protein ABJK59_02710, partial [Erythrobacter sp.]|uniref:hypothetical protein n=1 Tax=Erythrobacter sp. TaxID=1042 RepID=UPI0032975753
MAFIALSLFPLVQLCPTLGTKSKGISDHVTEAVATEKPEKPGIREVFRALKNRKSAFMALFGFTSGLPFALFLGTLYA